MLDRIIYGILAASVGGLVSLTSFAMTSAMLISPETRANNLFVVGLFGLAFAPPIFVAGIRLLLNKPNIHGGIFSPFSLRILAIINGVLGGIMIIFGFQEGDITTLFGGISFLLTTQGAFVMANRRSET